MPTKNKRFCDYKDCGLPENNKGFLVQFFYLAVVFIILIKDVEKVTILNMILFVAPNAIDVMCFKHMNVIQRGVRIGFIVILALFGFLSCLAIFGVLIEDGVQYYVVDTFPALGHMILSKGVLLCLTASMIGVPLFMFYSRPNKEQARAIAYRENAIQGE